MFQVPVFCFMTALGEGTITPDQRVTIAGAPGRLARAPAFLMATNLKEILACQQILLVFSSPP